MLSPRPAIPPGFNLDSHFILHQILIFFLASCALIKFLTDVLTCYR